MFSQPTTKTCGKNWLWATITKHFSRFRRYIFVIYKHHSLVQSGRIFIPFQHIFKIWSHCLNYSLESFFRVQRFFFGLWGRFSVATILRDQWFSIMDWLLKQLMNILVCLTLNKTYGLTTYIFIIKQRFFDRVSRLSRLHTKNLALFGVKV